MVVEKLVCLLHAQYMLIIVVIIVIVGEGVRGSLIPSIYLGVSFLDSLGTPFQKK